MIVAYLTAAAGVVLAVYVHRRERRIQAATDHLSGPGPRGRDGTSTRNGVALAGQRNAPGSDRSHVRLRTQPHLHRSHPKERTT